MSGIITCPMCWFYRFDPRGCCDPLLSRLGDRMMWVGLGPDSAATICPGFTPRNPVWRL